MELNLIKRLAKKAQSRIVFLVMDGLGGLPMEPGGRTELESAKTPNLDAMAKEGICGLHEPIGPGITPGSGPAHLALFGYDPIKYQVGRGVLAALGIDFDLRKGAVAARGNFCTVDKAGLVTDRRAGRISTDENQRLCELLSGIELSNADVFVQTVKEHRFLVVLRGDGLSGQVADTDPQQTGETPLAARALADEAHKTVELVAEFTAKAQQLLTDSHPANMILLRGFSQRPAWPTMTDAFGLKAAAIASYPMYRGLGRLIGMQALNTGSTLADEFDTLKQHWADFDFFYVHVKAIDSAGEDGDFDRKVSHIEKTDAQIPQLLELKPDVVVVTGDHSTPAAMEFHSWHPVPVLLWSRQCRGDNVESFGERACVTGSLGPNIPAVNLMPLALANAGRLEKFGA